jgi:Paf1
MNAHECQPPTFITHECKEKVCLIGSESCPFFKILAILHRNVELLIRARYSNPLPPPPCPPKLINIPTNPMRYAGPEFLNRLAAHTPLPMIVDAECGMPLDLLRWECLWDDNADDSGEIIPHSHRLL